MTKRYILSALAGAALVIASPALAEQMGAQEFVRMATIGGMFEVQSSKVAMEKSQSEDVKDFAQMMINDHGAANAKLATIAEQEKLKVPAELDKKHQGSLDTLRKTKGNFDLPYVKMQRQAHQEAIKLFQNYSEDGKDAALKAFAEETLPTLKMHQDKVMALSKSMQGGEVTTGATK